MQPGALDTNEFGHLLVGGKSALRAGAFAEQRSSSRARSRCGGRRSPSRARKGVLRSHALANFGLRTSELALGPLTDAAAEQGLAGLVGDELDTPTRTGLENLLVARIDRQADERRRLAQIAAAIAPEGSRVRSARPRTPRGVSSRCAC